MSSSIKGEVSSVRSGEGKDATGGLVVLGQLGREPAAVHTGHPNGPGFAPCPSPVSLGHLLSLEQPCLLGRGGWGEPVRHMRRVHKSRYRSTRSYCHPAWNSGVSMTCGPCGHEIPPSKSLPAGCWVNLAFEEGKLEGDAGLVGPG